MNLDIISDAFVPHGLIVRGGFHPTPEDLVPALPSGALGETVVMVGNSGPQMWEKFAVSPERELDHDPLNTWTRTVVSAVAMALGADALYPFSGPAYYPFQRWAARAEAVWSSPIGILIHPEVGLWHGYRAALIFEQRLALPLRVTLERPCDSCEERPCLKTCPVGAFTGEGYDVPSCVSFMSSQDGSDCVSLGCRARRACPVGTAFLYDPPQAEFHQQAFLRSHPRPEVEP